MYVLAWLTLETAKQLSTISSTFKIPPYNSQVRQHRHTLGCALYNIVSMASPAPYTSAFGPNVILNLRVV